MLCRFIVYKSKKEVQPCDCTSFSLLEKTIISPLRSRFFLR